MANFVRRALDATGWRAHKIQTDLTYAVEKGRAFTGSARFTVLAGGTDYIEFRIPTDVRVRVYERIVATTGDTFNVDLVRADSITAGDTELIHACLNCVIGDLPQARLWRGVTGATSHNYYDERFMPPKVDAFEAARRLRDHRLKAITGIEVNDKRESGGTMQHLTVDTRELTKGQFEALKAAAEAAGLDVRYWMLKDRERGFVFATTEDRDDFTDDCPTMRRWVEEYDPELVTYPEALRRLAEAAEPSKEDDGEVKAHPHAENMRLYAEDAAETDRPWERWEILTCFGWDTMASHPRWNPDNNYHRKPKPQKTPAQEAGFEVGDLGVVISSRAFRHIVRLVDDDGSANPWWLTVDGGYLGPAGKGDCLAPREAVSLSRVRKLYNVKEA